MARKRRFVVAAYVVHQCYGGPEEGGWWYDVLEPAQAESSFYKKFTKVFKSQGKAFRYCEKLGNLLRNHKVQICVEKGTYPLARSNWSPWE